MDTTPRTHADSIVVRAAPNETEPRYRLGLFLLQNGRETEGLSWLNGVGTPVTWA